LLKARKKVLEAWLLLPKELQGSNLYKGSERTECCILYRQPLQTMQKTVPSQIRMRQGYVKQIQEMTFQRGSARHLQWSQALPRSCP